AEVTKMFRRADRSAARYDPSTARRTPRRVEECTQLLHLQRPGCDDPAIVEGEGLGDIVEFHERDGCLRSVRQSAAPAGVDVLRVRLSPGSAEPGCTEGPAVTIEQPQGGRIGRPADHGELR